MKNSTSVKTGLHTHVARNSNNNQWKDLAARYANASPALKNALKIMREDRNAK